MSPPKTSRSRVEDISPMVIRQNNDLSRRLHHTVDFSVSSSLSNLNHYNNNQGFETDSLSATSSFIAIFPSYEKNNQDQNIRSSNSTSFFHYNNKTSEGGEIMTTKWEQQIKVNPTDRSGLRKRKKRPAPPPPSFSTRPPFSHVPGKRKAPAPPQLTETFSLVHEQHKSHLAPSSTLESCFLASSKDVIKLDYIRDSEKRVLEPSKKTSVLVNISQLDRGTTEIIHVKRQKESMRRRMDDERFSKRQQLKEELEMEKPNRDLRRTLGNHQKTEEKNVPTRDPNKERTCCLVCTYCIDRLWRHTLRRRNRNQNQRKPTFETLIRTSSVICLCSTLQWQTETIKGYFNTTKNPYNRALPILSKVEQHNNTNDDPVTSIPLREARDPNNFSTQKNNENIDKNRSKSFPIVESSMGNSSKREAAPSFNTKNMMSSLLHSLEESIASDQFDQAVFIAKELAAFKRSTQDMINKHPKEFNYLLIKELDSGPAPPPIIKPVPPLRITSLYPSNAVLHPQPTKRGFKYGINPIINKEVRLMEMIK